MHVNIQSKSNAEKGRAYIHNFRKHSNTIGPKRVHCGGHILLETANDDERGIRGDAQLFDHDVKNAS